MTHREAESLVPDLTRNPPKGYWAGSKPGWSLQIMFDHDLRIESITKDFTCEHHGLRNRMIYHSKSENYERNWRTTKTIPKP
jgi:hypothetical protein